MALLDEWNEQINRTTSGLQQLRVDSQDTAEAAPLFALDHRSEFLAQGRGHAVAFAASNDSIFLATSRNFVLRHDTDRGDVVELELTKLPDARVRRLFVDPLGAHALVTVQSGNMLDTFYLDRWWKKARPLPKLRNIVITSAAWPPVIRASTLSEVVLGTDKGTLYELGLEEPKYEKLQQLCTLRGSSGPVAGLAQVALEQGTQDRLVLALCGTKLHLFRGGPTLEGVFAAYGAASLPSKEPKSFDLPIEQGAAQLQLLTPPKLPDHSSSLDSSFHMPQPTEFAVLSTSGVYYGRLDLDPLRKDDLDHLSEHKLLPAGSLQQSGGASGPPERPLTLALTQHHIVLLYPSRLKFINRSNKRLVQEIPLERFAAPLRGVAALPLGLCRDALGGRVLVLAGDDAFEVDASDEDRDIWKVMLGQGEYAAALPYCRTATQRNKVYLQEADALLADGQPAAAAGLYGKVTAASPPFEDLALRLMESGDPDALRTFLSTRLGTLGPEDRAQATMVATWLLELLLDRANRAALQRRSGDEAEALCAAAGADVQRFLEEKVGVLDPGTTITLLEGYGRGQDVLAYARARGDHEATLECLVQRGEAERALEVLRKPSVSAELAYRYAPALVALAPAQTVQSWIDSSPALDPRRLLPALLHLADSAAKAPRAARAEALRYVGHAVSRLGSVDAALHDFAVALLVLEPENERDLLEHLTSARDALGVPLYDAVHALRLSREHGRRRATVALLAEVGLWEDAVELALEIDSQLAEEVAVRPEGNDALTRKLWLGIVRHVVGGGLAADEEQKKAQVREVSRLLDRSSGAIRIEDVLPMFPDFVEIGAFRDAICTSLERYNEEMERLRGEMGLATRTAAALRESLELVEGRVGAVDLEAPCARCERPLHQQPPTTAGPSGGALPRLFLFPTGNAFHGSCLCAEAADLAPPPQRKRIQQLARRLAGLPEGVATAPASGDEPVVSIANLRKQLEDEIAVDDPYCGEIVARHITKPLISPDEAEAAASWAL